MEALYLLIPLSVVLVGLAVWIFFRMQDSGQFDDMDSPAHAILLDDDRPVAKPPGERPPTTLDPDSAPPRPPGRSDDNTQ